MLATLKLYNKNISPKNLPIFESEEDRETFFSDYDKIYQNISYNGTRNIRLKLNSIESNLEYYNYAVIEWTINGKQVKYYCFIDGTAFVNDNVAEIYLTLDYVTTFYFDIIFRQFIIKQKTMNTKQDKYFPISNKLPSVYEKKVVKDFSYKFNIKDTKLGNISLNIKFLLISIAENENTGDFTIYENGVTKNICLIFPLLYQDGEKYTEFLKAYPSNKFALAVNNKVYFYGYGDRNSTGKIYFSSLETIMNKFQGEILNVSVIDNLFNTHFVEDGLDRQDDNNLMFQDAPENTELLIYHNLNNNNIYISLLSGKNAIDTSYDTSYDLEPSGEDFNTFFFITERISKDVTISQNVNKNMINRNYRYYSIINNSSSLLNQFSLYDFSYNDMKSDTFDICVNISIDPVFPNPYILQIYLKGNQVENEIVRPNKEELRYIKVDNKASSVQFSQTAWSEYVVNNSASVMDSLNTKHQYDLQEANLKRDQGQYSAIANAVGGVANAGIGLWTGNPVSVSGTIQGVTNAITSIISTEYAYRIAENNIEKEKALLQISYNDVKAKPNNYYNFGVGNNFDTLIPKGLSFVEESVIEVTRDIIKSYHMEYGYKIDYIYNSEGLSDFKTLNDVLDMFQDPNQYVFIRLESDFVVDNIPIFARSILRRIFADGVKFYNKGRLMTISRRTYGTYIEDEDF